MPRKFKSSAQRKAVMAKYWKVDYKDGTQYIKKSATKPTKLPIHKKITMISKPTTFEKFKAW